MKKIPGAKSAFVVMLFLAVVVIASLGCIGQNNQSSQLPTSAQPAAVTLRISGSTTALPFVELAAEQYNSEQKNVTVSVSGGGSGVGISDLIAGNSNIGMISRDLTNADRNLAKNTSKTFEATAIAYDSIVIAVSPDVYNSGVKALSTAQLKAIYAGNITNWKQVGGFDQPIYVISREDGSGTRDTFDQYVMGSTTAETNGVKTVAGSNSEAQLAISDSKVAIGYLGIGFINDKVRAVKLNGMLANVTNTRDRTYPLSRKLYLVTLGDPSQQAQQFIKYCLGPEAQQIASANGFVAL